MIILFQKNLIKRRSSAQKQFLANLTSSSIPWKYLKNYNTGYKGVLIGTLFGTKGLEADTIAIPELDTFNTSEERQLLYVGMTRARKQLLLTAKKETSLVQDLKEHLL